MANLTSTDRPDALTAQGRPVQTRRSFLLSTLPKVIALPAGAALLAACGQAASTSTQAKATTAATKTAGKSSSSASASSSSTASSNTAIQGGQAVWGNYGTLSFMNPILVADTATALVVGFMFDPLVNFDTKYNPIPGLAEKWETSSNHKDWTFHLRTASWHDGQPFTSADVAFTIAAVLHPGYTGQRVTNYLQLVGANTYVNKTLKGLQAQLKKKQITSAEFNTQSEAAWKAWVAQNAVETPDPHTVVFHLETVFAPFLTDISSPIPKHLLENHLGAAMDTASFSTHPVGTGPFKFKGGNPKESITVERFDQYWGNKAWLDGIVTKIIPEITTAETALQSKQLDISQLQPQDAGRFKKLSFIDVMTSPRFAYEYMGYNLKKPLFQDENLRIAICYATPKDQMVKTLLQGYGGVSWTHGSPARWDYNPNVVKYEYDPAKAKALLAKSGWKPNSAGKLMKNGQPLKFTISTSQGNGTPQKATVIVQQALNQIGMDVAVRQFDWSTFVNKVLLAKNFDAAVVGWSLGPDPDSYSIWHSGESFNFVSFNNAQVDKLEVEGRTTISQSARKKIYQQIEAILAQQQPYLFLYYQDDIQGVNKRLQGPITDSPRGLSWNVDAWWVPKGMQGGPQMVSG